MARNWTEKQRQAIDTRDRTLLISAAAGSGKTATLTERVISSILDKDNPIEVNEILAVTFTNAAALELREKITARISAALADCGESVLVEGGASEGEAPEMEEESEPLQTKTQGESVVQYLRRQLELLPLAHIRTIDSFCNEILKQNSASVNLPPNYRIAEEAEILLISDRVMDNLMESVLHGLCPEIASPEEFLSLTDAMVGVKHEEGIIPAFLYIYNKTKTHEDGVASLHALVEEYALGADKPFEKTTFGSYLIREVNDYAGAYTDAMAKYIRALEDVGDSGSLKVAERFYKIRDALFTLKEATTYGEMRRHLLALPYPELRGLPSGERRTADMKALISLYQEFKELFKEKFAPRFFTYTEDALDKLCQQLHHTLGIFVRFLVRFDELFVAQKKQMGIAEHSDIERYAYECLYDKKTKQPTEFAISLRNSFRAVYIDEYQDVNRLQDKIFEMISTPYNRFMVGDIKQSIYSFRSAAPGIFADLKENYPIFSDTGADKHPASIFMSNNFRSDRGVVDFVNGVFDCVFRLTGQSIRYVYEDRLICSKYRDSETGEPPYHRGEILLVESPPSKKKNTPEDEIDENLSAIECEARVVASRILEMLERGETKNDGTKIVPGDIAILLRSTKTKAKIFADALAKVGIPYAITQGDDFFLSPEVLLALCILNVVDNPQRDIYLAGLLLSPLYRFSADEVARIRGIRKEKVDGPLIFALQAFAKAHPEHLKTQKFLSDLAHYRAEAEGVGVDVLLSKLYYETGLITLASTHGGLDNLMLLHDFAERFEKNGFRGLYAFIQYINDIIRKNEKFDNRPEVPKGANVVRIITIHASKGLEYPVCFVSGAGTLIRDGDVMSGKGTLEFSEDFGLSLRLRDATGLISLDNPIVNIIKRRRMDLIFEEEMRILYVALTRARERLIVSALTGSDQENFLEKINLLRERLSPEVMHAQRTYIGPILLSGVDVDKRYDRRGEGEEFSPEADDETRRALQEASLEEFAFLADEEDDLTDTLVEHFSYRYPNEIYTKLPTKLSVSYLSPTILDGNEEQEKVALTIEELLGEISPKSEIETLLEDGDILTPFDDMYEGDSTVKVEESENDNPEKPTETQTTVSILPEFYDGEPLDAPARRGTATHIMLQFADFNRLAKTSAEEELRRLIDDKFISKRDGSFVRVREVERFRFSKLIRRMQKAKNMWREFRFHATLPAHLFTRDEEKKKILQNVRLLVQGVIDCLFEEEDGSLVLIDYKTDRIPGEIYQDRERVKAFFNERHHQQLFYYTLAIEQMFGKRPDRVEIYSTALADTIPMDV
ncbi:MAG: UvrD-helicase domain-containing protein [Clostridia bacterium]|nr:UvrD-helicase domain-containing protein [Clostridia bacterium]